MVHEILYSTRAKFKSAFLLYFSQRGTFHVDYENSKLLFITIEIKTTKYNFQLYMKNVISIRNL